MTSVFTLCFCLVGRILFGYLVKTYHFFLNIQKIMELTVKVFGVLCIAAAVWSFSMLIWELVKQITKIKSIEVPIINNYYAAFDKKISGKIKVDGKSIESILDNYEDGGYEK